MSLSAHSFSHEAIFGATDIYGATCWWAKLWTWAYYLVEKDDAYHFLSTSYKSDSVYAVFPSLHYNSAGYYDYAGKEETGFYSMR